MKTKYNIKTLDKDAINPKPPTKIIYVGFEKTHANSDNNIDNYDAIKIFESERAAIDWKFENEQYRTYKYCGKLTI